ncbi:MAG: hemerythrin domain-containing protein [Proteobacteria bacterium]|nr:hemerythrin domain-containing protein [Pseudomonadota bacterium]
MSDVIAALKLDHANIAKILELLESEILAIEVGKTPDYPLLQDIMCYMNQYPDRFHHRKEDLILAQLVKCDPTAGAAVSDALDEHISIGLAGREFDRLLGTSDVDSVDVRERLGKAAFAYIRALRQHMLLDEKKLFPLAIAVLTDKDWQEIEGAVDAIEDPLFETMIADSDQRLYRLITDQSRSDAVSTSAGDRGVP